MKILLVVPYLGGGGITTAAFGLMNLLVEKGHEVSFLNMADNKTIYKLNCPVNSVSLSGTQKYWNVNLNDLNNYKKNQRLFLLFLGLFKKIMNRFLLWEPIIFKKRKDYYDVALAFNQNRPCYYYVLKCCNAGKKIAFIHGDVDFMQNNEKTFINFMPKFDKCAFVSQSACNNFVKKYPFLSENAFVINNALDTHSIIKSASKSSPIKNSNVVNIVTVARIDNEYKQIDWIPKVCAKLIQEGIDDFHWHIIGIGNSYESNIELSKRLKTEKVLSFVGQKENPFTYFKNSDFSVLCSKSEAYPMVVIESLFLGKPVVVTNFSSAHEMVTDGYNGVISEMNVDSLTTAVANMITDKGQIRTKLTANLNGDGNLNSNEKVYQQFCEAIK